jgi:hypothetical protein
MQIREHTERLRALADALARPDADPLAIGRQLHSLASQLEHEAHAETTRTASGARPGLAGGDRLWRDPR